ncbi:hypothetical protein ACFQX6_38660 [Streptosporangium lutulentum]
MDEITLLSSSLPDAPPPAPEVVARARARLAAHEVRRRPRHTWALIIGAATATAAVVTAAALAATLLARARPVSAPASPTPKSGARLLLNSRTGWRGYPPRPGPTGGRGSSTGLRCRWARPPPAT